MPDASLSDLSVSIEASPPAVRLPANRWSIAWTVRNKSSRPLEIHEIRMSHDQFRAEDMTVHPPLLIPGGSVGSISSVVGFDEPPGSTLTYPFLILGAKWQGVPCRLFGRLRVESSADGAPHPMCEEVTVRALSPER
jgi:hypothetical protein